jgi:ribonucleoside-diphosphate reductase alpha chain
MIDQGFPWEWALGKEGNTVVFSFPVEGPKDSVFRDDRPAIQQLEHWLLYQRHWCEHKPSVTIYVHDEEWPEVGAWVWEHFDEMSGVSFLPHNGGNYKQAPYQEIDEETYKRNLAAMPKDVDWTKLRDYEDDDNTTGSQELACKGNTCELAS